MTLTFATYHLTPNFGPAPRKTCMRRAMLLLLCWAVRPGLSDAAREGGSVSRPPYDYIAMAKNKNVHGDRETALKVINRNLNRASGTMEEKMAVTSPIPLPPRDTRLLISACQPGLHAASRPATSTTTPPSQPPSHFLPRSRGRLLLHRPPLTRCSPHPLQSAALSMGLYDSFGNVKTKVNFLRIVGTALASAGFMTAALGMVVQAYGPDDVIAQFLNSKKPLFMVLQATCIFFGIALASQLASASLRC